MWEFLGGSQYTEHILPQGVVEIVFNLAEPIKGKLPNADSVAQAPLCFIQGIHTHTLTAYYSGAHHLFGIRLRPYTVKDFLNILSREASNQAIDAVLVKPEFRNLWHQLCEAKSFRERVMLVENSFRFDSVPGCSRSARICELFYSNQIDSFKSVDQLAREVCYSSRQLSRKSHELFGLSAEELILYKKFMYSVNLMHRENSRLVDIALQSGFYDQPHFNKVFKSFTGLTPKEYYSQKTSLPFHLFI
ncbi:AraC family transcriptional regulator [Melioribacter roseus P3M-2]|uniref:AraC family transcriptional regulator n=2 Tax=Melioribacteraceae TaxID=1334117 RepID=I6Z4R8_MELRP|nr:AraC family transcriptional regulator [Melioribacter roseus P3M-2]